MVVRISKASDWDYEEYRVVSDLNEFLNILSEFKHSIVVAPPGKYDRGNHFDYSVTIYDDYME